MPPDGREGEREVEEEEEEEEQKEECNFSAW
jgi:hypothetical protein